jgi:predicted transposase/invertase (TIGR01784 family)
VSEEICKKARRDNDSLQGVKTNWKGSHAAITVMITNREYGENVFKTNFPAQSIREPEIINTYRMTHSINPDQYLGNDARVVLVMLSNFHKNEEELQTIEDKWLFAFKDTQLSTGTDRIPTYKHIENLNKVQDDNDEGLKQFYQALNKEAMEMKTDLKCYERGINNLNKVLDSKKMEGIIEGKMEGIIEGIIEGKREIVCKMLSKNLSDDIILECSNLTFDELAEIKRSL